MKRSILLRLACVLLSAMLLASCGGGGGGGSDSGSGGGTSGGSGSGSGSGTSSSLNVTTSVSSLSFVGFANSPLTSQSISFNVVNGGSGTYYGRALADHPSAFHINFEELTGTSAQVTIWPALGTSGKWSGNFTFQLCTDANCNNVVWSQNIPYTFAMFSVSAAPLTINGSEGAVSPQTTIAISPADTDHLLVASPYNSGNWLTASINANGIISVGTSGSGLLEGNYQGNVFVAVAGTSNSQPVIVPVSFNVGDGIAAPPAQTVNFGVNSTAATLNGSIPVTFNGNQNPTWTASSDQAWLVLNNASGTGAGTLGYTINIAKLNSMANANATNTANVTITAAGLTGVTVPVTFNMNLPAVYSVSSVMVAGRPNTVKITGHGLSQLSDVSQIKVAGVSGVTGTISSDTTAVLNLPAVSAGRYAVSIPNAAGIATRTATISAGNLSSLPYAFVANTGEQNSALFDPTRNAFYAINTSNNALTSYTYSGSQWVVNTLPSTNGGVISGIAMSPDRGTIYMLSGSTSLLAVDPDALTVKATYALPQKSLYSYYGGNRPMAISNDMKLWFDGSQVSLPLYFDLLNFTVNVQPLVSDIANSTLYTPSYYASGDGSLVMAAQQFGAATGNYEYVAATGTLGLPGNEPYISSDATLTQDGSKILVDGFSLYDTAAFSLIGNVPATTVGSGVRAILSPDGTRIYQLVTNGTDGLTIDHIQVYDTTQFQAGSTNFAPLGQIAVSDQAASCGQNTIGCGYFGNLTISPLGDTLFWAGNQGMVVLPIPGTMSNVKAQTHRLLKARR
jgi:hypothetical protein